jgi:hypothetical protein
LQGPVLRDLREARQAPGHLADVQQPKVFQPAEELGLGAVALVEGEPVEADAVGDRPLDLAEGQQPLAGVDDVVGDVGGLAPLAVLVPGVLGQVQVRVERGHEVAAAAGEVDGDEAVVDLAAGPAVLPLHARRLVPLLGHGGLGGQVLAATRRCSSSRIRSWSQAWWVRNSWSVRTAHPAARAIGSTLLRGRSESSPRQ